MTARKSASINPLSCEEFFSEIPGCSSSPSSSFDWISDFINSGGCLGFNNNIRQITLTVAPHKSLTILDSIKQPAKLGISHFITTMAEKETDKEKNIAHSAARCTFQETSLTNEKFSNNRVCSSSTRKRASTDLSTSKISTKRMPTIFMEKIDTKRVSKRNETKSLQSFLNNCDKKAALEMLLADEEIDAKDTIIQRYFETRKQRDLDKEGMQREVSGACDDNLKSDVANSTTEMSSLQKIKVANQKKSNNQFLDIYNKNTLVKNDTNLTAQMSQEILASLHKYIGDDFVDAVFETFRNQFKSSKVLEVLKPDELENVILDKFTAHQLLNLFRKSVFKNKNNQSVLEHILELTSPEMIVNHVQSTDNLKTSKPLLNVLLENFSPTVSEESNQHHKIKPDSDEKMINGVVNLVNSIKDLKTSESLLNVLLKHGPRVVSDETRNNIKRFLMKNFDAHQLNDLLHELTNLLLNARVISLD